MSTRGADIRDIKGLIPLGSLGLFFLIVAVLVVLFVLLFFYLKRRRQTAASPPAVPPRRPHEIALEKLSELGSMSLTDPAAIKRFHFALSETAREYLEGQFRLPATDRTVEELEVEMERLMTLDPSRAKDCLELLKRADLVKFTDMNPGEASSRELLDRAREFVRETSRVKEPSTAPEGVTA